MFIQKTLSIEASETFGYQIDEADEIDEVDRTHLLPIFADALPHSEDGVDIFLAKPAGDG